MNNKMKLPRRLFWLGGTLVVLIAALAAGYMYFLQRTLDREMQTYLREVAQQGVKILQTQLEGDLSSLRSVATAVSSYESFDKEKMLPLLREAGKNNGFKRMTFISPEGVGILSDGAYLDASGQTSFRRAMKGEENISDRFQDATDRKEILVEAVPVKENGEIRGVLTGTRSIDAYADALAVPTFGGEGYSVIARANGDKVVYSFHKNAVSDLSNIFDSGWKWWETPAQLEKMKSDMAAGRSGMTPFLSRNHKRMYVNYVPLGINDWYLLSVVPVQPLKAKAAHFLLLTTVLILSVLAAFLALVGYLFASQKRNKERLYRLAYTDGVTGYPNFAKKRAEIPALLQENVKRRYAFVVLDVDKFKTVNDVYGHEKGNMLLTHISNVLSESLETGEEFSRLNADMFQALLKFKDEGELKNRLQVINEKIVNFKAPDDMTYQLVLSFGVYVIEDPALSVESMLDRALYARQTVKGKLLDTVAFYSDDIRRRASRAKRLENSMDGALARREFELLLQPVYNLLSGRIQGAEVSVWWNHPQEGVLSEADFIPLFERNGFITRLDLFVLEESCKLAAKYLGKMPGSLEVNISRLQIYNLYFPTALGLMAKKAGIPGHALALSLSGDTDMQETEKALVMMNRLHEEGFKLVVNCSDRGLSSLSLLKGVPAEIMRLATHLLEDGHSVERSEKMLAGMVSMAKHLNMKTLAEGIDSEAQLAVAQRLGCDYAAGAVYGGPVPPDAFEKQFL